MTSTSETDPAMNQVNNSEIDVNELMQKIRKEVASRGYVASPTAPFSFSQPSEISLVSNYIEDLLTNAESRSHVRSKWPDKLNRFPFKATAGIRRILLKAINFLFKEQRTVNLSLIQALRESVKLNRQAAEQISDLNRQILDLNKQTPDLNVKILDLSGKISDLNRHIPDLNRQIPDLNRQILDLNRQILDLKGQILDLNGQLVLINRHIQDTDKRTLTNDIYIKNDLIQQKRLTTMFLEEAHKRLPIPFTTDELQDLAQEEQHQLDAFYVAFEDQFRGDRETIYERLKVYIPVLEAANMDYEAQILDVGCGRGEWLDLLHSCGYKAKGIDINRVMLEQCKARGFEVTESDVVEYLKSSPDASLGAVTGFHIIEHLSFDDLMKLFSETSRVLKQGGVAIFETPNPQNLLVSSNNFYIDPTHRNPLPSELISFLLKYIGFSSVEIIYLHSFDDSVKIAGTDTIIQRFNEYFYTSQDYAVVGIK